MPDHFLGGLERGGVPQRETDGRRLAEIGWRRRRDGPGKRRRANQILRIARARHGQVLWIAAIGEVLRIAGIDARRISLSERGTAAQQEDRYCSAKRPVHSFHGAAPLQAPTGNASKANAFMGST